MTPSRRRLGGAAGAARPDPHVLLRPDRLPARSTSATRGRSSSRMWLRRWLRERGYDVTLVENITDVNDKIYEAAPGAQRGAGRGRRPSGTSRTRATSGSGMPDIGRGDRVACRRSSAPSRSSSSAAPPTRSRATSTSASRGYPTTASCRGQRPDQVEEQEPNPRKEDPRDFALWKANKPGEDTSWDVAVGPGPARLAHRVLRDGGGAPRPGVRDPRRRPRPRLPAPRERAGAVARARPRVRADLDAQRDARSRPARRCRSRSATSSRSGRRSTLGAGDDPRSTS